MQSSKRFAWIGRALAISFVFARLEASPVRLIFDTDMGNDVDAPWPWP
jgi:hypothetical protein